MNPIKYGGAEATEFRRRALHAYAHDGGGIEVWGDGARVMMIRHAGRKSVAEAVILESVNLFGEPFRYRDFFPPLGRSPEWNPLDPKFPANRT